VLHRALQLGYSTRYNDRSGMGRFGIGAKLAGISQAQRIEIYSRQQASQPWLYTYIDLTEIHDGSMTSIPEPTPSDLPSDCNGLVGSEHGILVIWSKTDRLAERVVLGNAILRLLRFHVGVEALEIEAQRLRVAVEIRGLHRVLVRKQQLVHRPEFSL